MALKKPIKIGVINERVIDKLNLTIPPDTFIYMGESNLQHIKDKHPDDFEKYGDKVTKIIHSPDYIAKHPHKNSIEYIKIYYNGNEKEYILLAVRATNVGIKFARTLFTMSQEKVNQYHVKGALKNLQK